MSTDQARLQAKRDEWLDEWFEEVRCTKCRAYLCGIHCTGPGGTVVHVRCHGCGAGVAVAHRPMKPILWSPVACSNGADGVRRLRAELRGKTEVEELLSELTVLEAITCPECGKVAFSIHCVGCDATAIRSRCSNKRCPTWIVALRWEVNPATEVFHGTTVNAAYARLQERVRRSSEPGRWQLLLGLDLS